MECAGLGEPFSNGWAAGSPDCFLIHSNLPLTAFLAQVGMEWEAAATAWALEAESS